MNLKKLKNDFANPRNAASGSLRQKDPKKTELIPLKFIAYTFGFSSSMKSNKQSDFIKNLNKWGFKTSELNKKIKGIDNLINYDKTLPRMVSNRGCFPRSEIICKTIISNCSRNCIGKSY